MFPAVLAEMAALAQVGDGCAEVFQGAGRQVARVGLLSLGFAAVAFAVLGDSSPVSVVAVAQQVLWNR